MGDSISITDFDYDRLREGWGRPLRKYIVSFRNLIKVEGNQVGLDALLDKFKLWFNSHTYSIILS